MQKLRSENTHLINIFQMNLQISFSSFLPCSFPSPKYSASLNPGNAVISPFPISVVWIIAYYFYITPSKSCSSGFSFLKLYWTAIIPFISLWTFWGFWIYMPFEVNCYPGLRDKILGGGGKFELGCGGKISYQLLLIFHSG